MTLRPERGNHLSEWFGFRVWPEVDASLTARDFQLKRNCPFITAATSQVSPCAKQGRTGVCTISSPSNGPRQEWLACPFRILDTHFTLLSAATRRLFGVADDDPIVLRPISALGTRKVFEEVTAAVATGTRVFLFSQTGLGGEVKVPETIGSPGLEVDSTVVELERESTGACKLGRYGLFEIQTMDFHGSPLHTTLLLEKAREADPENYHEAIGAQQSWTGERIEGPNTANVFKRTIYQTILKIQLTRDERCVGFAMLLPEPVWDSWTTHLGLPELIPDGDLWRLRAPGETGGLVEPDRAWIYVSDIDLASTESPRPLKIVKTIATTSAALVHHAFEAASTRAVEAGAMTSFAASLEARIRKHWPAGGTSLWDVPLATTRPPTAKRSKKSG